MSALEDSDLDKNTTDFLVPIFIYSATWSLSPKEQQYVKAFVTRCDEMTGVVPIVVITNKTRGDYFEVEKKFRLMGAETVFAIENYTKESNVKTLGKSTDILKIIEMALENVIFRMSLPRDPEIDRIERKKFLLQYIHKAMFEHELGKSKEDDTSQEKEGNKTKKNDTSQEKEGNKTKKDDTSQEKEENKTKKDNTNQEKEGKGCVLL